MSSFRPYKKPNHIILPYDFKAKTEERLPRKIPKINYLERTLEDGTIVKINVVDENAVQTLLGNGFKRSYPEPGEVVSVETSPENTKHVICRPSPILPFLNDLTPYTLASFLQPTREEIFRYRIERSLGIFNNKRIPTKAEYLAAISQNPNPLLHLKPRKVKAPRGRYPKLSQKSVLEQIMAEAEKNAKNREAVAKAQFLCHQEESRQ